MILDLNADVLPFLQLSADDAYGNVARIQSDAESFVKSYCARNFEVVAMQEVVELANEPSFWLKEYPVVSVQKMAVGEDSALTVTNSNTATAAQVSVTSTGVSLSYNYGAATVLLFATYANLTALANAINSAGNGWSAIVTGGFEQTLSTELIPQFNLEAINSAQVQLAVPRQALAGYRLNNLTGEVVTGRINLGQGGYIARRFPGVYPDFDMEHDRPQYAYAYYTAGYATIPNDLKLGVLVLIQSVYDKVLDGSFGVTSYRLGGVQKIVKEDIPGETRAVLDLYKRRRF